MEMAERISELEERSIEITHSEEQRKKTGGGKNLRDPWDKIKLSNVWNPKRNKEAK